MISDRILFAKIWNDKILGLILWKTLLLLLYQR
jgi:hypothetical protein